MVLSKSTPNWLDADHRKVIKIIIAYCQTSKSVAYKINRKRNGEKIRKKYANQEPEENVISVTILYQASFGLACYEQAGVFSTLLCFEPFIFREVLNNNLMAKRLKSYLCMSG